MITYASSATSAYTGIYFCMFASHSAGVRHFSASPDDERAKLVEKLKRHGYTESEIEGLTDAMYSNAQTGARSLATEDYDANKNAYGYGRGMSMYDQDAIDRLTEEEEENEEEVEQAEAEAEAEAEGDTEGEVLESSGDAVEAAEGEQEGTGEDEGGESGGDSEGGEDGEGGGSGEENSDGEEAPRVAPVRYEIPDNLPENVKIYQDEFNGRVYTDVPLIDPNPLENLMREAYIESTKTSTGTFQKVIDLREKHQIKKDKKAFKTKLKSRALAELAMYDEPPVEKEVWDAMDPDVKDIVSRAWKLLNRNYYYDLDTKLTMIDNLVTMCQYTMRPINWEKHRYLTDLHICIRASIHFYTYLYMRT